MDDEERLRRAADVAARYTLPGSPEATSVLLAAEVVRLEGTNEELMLEIADLRLQIGGYKAQLHGLQADLAGEVQRRETAESLLPDADVFEWIDDMVMAELGIAESYVDGPSVELLDAVDWVDAYRPYISATPTQENP